MTNEPKEIIDDVEIPDGDIEIIDDDGEGDEPKGDQPEKPKETPEAKRARLARMLSQHDKKYGKPEEPVKQNKSGEIGYAEKAFLIANGVKGSKETALVQEIMKSTGKSLDDVLESKYFQAELKELREGQAAADAIPKGTKRSGNSSRDTVDYWMAKGELPPADMGSLRQQVVNARIQAEKNNNMFTSQAVIK